MRCKMNNFCYNKRFDTFFIYNYINSFLIHTTKLMHTSLYMSIINNTYQKSDDKLHIFQAILDSDIMFYNVSRNNKYIIEENIPKTVDVDIMDINLFEEMNRPFVYPFLLNRYYSIDDENSDPAGWCSTSFITTQHCWTRCQMPFDKKYLLLVSNVDSNYTDYLPLVKKPFSKKILSHIINHFINIRTIYLNEANEWEDHCITKLCIIFITWLIINSKVDDKEKLLLISIKQFVDCKASQILPCIIWSFVSHVYKDKEIY